MKSKSLRYIFIATSSLFCGTVLQAATYTIDGTGLFNQALGTLDSVDVQIEPTEAVLSESGFHSHTLNPTAFSAIKTSTGIPYGNGTTIDFLPISLSTVGSHTTSIMIGPFSTSLGMIQFPATVTSSDGSHFQTINFATATVGATTSGQLDLSLTGTNSTGEHSHTLVILPFVQSFSGGDLTPFLSGAPSATIDPPNTTSTTTGSHGHQLATGSYQAVINGGATEFVTIPTTFFTSTFSGSSHSVDFAPFDVTSTTFYYTPIPEPSTFALSILGICYLTLRRRNQK